MIEVIFQNQDFIVVNKPHGISVHNQEDKENLISVVSKEFKLKEIFPVHRLDKETSGVQILALNSEWAAKISNEFQKKNLKKIYHAILKGEMKKESGIWNLPISDKGEGRDNPAGKKTTRVEAVTEFSLLNSSPQFSFCEFNLLTGRQHQIRKHCALAKHPIVGDPRYNEPKYNKKIKNKFGIDRMFLHCSQIEIFDNNFIASLPNDFRLFHP